MPPGRVTRCVRGWSALGVRPALCRLPNQPFQQRLVTHSHVSHKLPKRVRLRELARYNNQPRCFSPPPLERLIDKRMRRLLLKVRSALERSPA